MRTRTISCSSAPAIQLQDASMYGTPEGLFLLKNPLAMKGMYSDMHLAAIHLSSTPQSRRREMGSMKYPAAEREYTITNTVSTTKMPSISVIFFLKA